MCIFPLCLVSFCFDLNNQKIKEIPCQNDLIFIKKIKREKEMSLFKLNLS